MFGLSLKTLRGILFALIGIGIALQCMLLFTKPLSFNQDEVSAVVESYSLVKEGTDRWGNPYPVYFVSWGTGQSVLYSYLTMPFVALFGLNEYTARIVILLASLVTILLTYLIARRAQLPVLYALLSAMIITLFEPFSRLFAIGLESQLLIPLWLATVYFLIRSVEQRRYIILAIITSVLSLYAYGLAVIWLPVLWLTYLWQMRTKLKALLPSLTLGVVITSIPLALYVNFLTTTYLKFSILPSNFLGTSVPSFITTRLEESLGGEYFFTVIKNIVVFLGGIPDGNQWLNAAQGYVNPLPLVITLGALAAVLLAHTTKSLPLALLSSSFIGASVCILLMDININRVNVWFASTPILFVYALFYYQLLSGRFRLYLASFIALGSVFSILTSVYVRPLQIEQKLFLGVPELIQRAEKLPDTLPVYVSERVTINYVFALYAFGLTSKEFLKDAQYERNLGGYYEVYTYKRFMFKLEERNYLHYAIAQQGELDSCVNAREIEKKTNYSLVLCSAWKLQP